MRAGPLQLHWEARGPGLLRQVATLIGGPVVPSQADVFLVRPLTGGGGFAWLAKNGSPGGVLFEAVLANPIPALPEIVRLAWLLMQTGIAAEQPTIITRLAAIPPILSAGEYVELNSFSESTIALAIERWVAPLNELPATPSPESLAANLFQWWSEFTAVASQANPANPDLTARFAAHCQRLANPLGTGS